MGDMTDKIKKQLGKDTLTVADIDAWVADKDNWKDMASPSDTGSDFGSVDWDKYDNDSLKGTIEALRRDLNLKDKIIKDLENKLVLEKLDKGKEIENDNEFGIKL